MKEGLEKSIQSLISQNSKDNIEYIVVDGMSSDGSQDVIEKYKDFIDILNIEKDKGIFDAMNKGLDLASGEYTYFLNSGDVFVTDDVITTVINLINEIPEVQNEYNIICGKVDLYRDNKYIQTADLRPWIPHQGAFVKTGILKKYRFDDNFKIYGDLDLWTRMRKNEDFSVYNFEKKIANFELDGIGNNPDNLHKQWKDKNFYYIKYKLYQKLLISSLLFIVDNAVYSIAGRYVFFQYKSKLNKSVKNLKKFYL
ncbi:MAG: glycosyltransferase [Richelia sp. RM1_1_1]|nr:glycosyltransferase [Richelia sp. RM1_1_1]